MITTRIRTKNLWKNIYKCTFAPQIGPASVNSIQYRKKSYEPNADLNQAQASEWRQIYRLPLARWVAGFNRLKVHQTIVTAVGAPASFALEQAGHLPQSSAIVFASIGITGLITLTLASLAVRNLVGIIYINSSGDNVKLAYITFWGRRRDQEIPIADIILNSDGPSKHFYQNIRTQTDGAATYKLLHRFGVLVDPQDFVAIFGE